MFVSFAWKECVPLHILRVREPATSLLPGVPMSITVSYKEGLAAAASRLKSSKK